MVAKWSALFALLVIGISIAHACKPTRTDLPLDWWQTMTLYQIYPRSFQDSDGDGTGDLKGITSRLEHLKELGVNAMWLSPIFSSPMADFGYDIANFTAIDPLFGTMDDFDDLVVKAKEMGECCNLIVKATDMGECYNLIVKAKEMGIKVILDFVPNHSSDESEWFVKSVNNEGKYSDYYVWRNASGYDGSDPLPPNNWLSVFYGPAWTWNENREQFYLHQFDPKQPDLNFRNPDVVQEMKDIFTFWLDKNVDGFRVDAIPHLYEDPSFRDEPLSLETNRTDDYAYLDHIYTANQPETFDMVNVWRELVDEYSRRDGVPRIVMTEAYADIDTTMMYYGTAETPGAHFTFNFQFIGEVNVDSSAQEIKNEIDVWMTKMPKGSTANWVVGNHDRHRVATRFGRDLADGMAMIIHLLPGVGVIYNGEEIGMVNSVISYNDTKDPQGCGAGPDHYEEKSRDPVRTPFQWDDTMNAGFSTANETWLPVHENYKVLNLADQRSQNDSHYKIYKRLLEARQTDTIKRGSLHTQVLNEDVFAFTRELTYETTYLVIVNRGGGITVNNLHDKFPLLPQQMTVYTANIGSLIEPGMVIETSSVYLSRHASLVLTGKPRERPVHP